MSVSRRRRGQFDLPRSGFVNDEVAQVRPENSHLTGALMSGHNSLSTSMRLQMDPYQMNHGNRWGYQSENEKINRAGNEYDDSFGLIDNTDRTLSRKDENLGEKQAKVGVANRHNSFQRMLSLRKNK
jgi:hypothetical protein